MDFPYDKIKLKDAAQKYRLRFVILHGSFATGKIHDKSDLDIAVLGKQPIDFQKELNLYVDMAKIFGDSSKRELDFKTLNRVDPFFRYEVIQNGILLYGDPTDYEEFKAYAYLAYEDAADLLELEHVLSKKYQKHLNEIAAKYA